MSGYQGYGSGGGSYHPPQQQYQQGSYYPYGPSIVDYSEYLCIVDLNLIFAVCCIFTVPNNRHILLEEVAVTHLKDTTTRRNRLILTNHPLNNNNTITKYDDQFSANIRPWL